MSATREEAREWLSSMVGCIVMEICEARASEERARDCGVASPSCDEAGGGSPAGSTVEALAIRRGRAEEMAERHWEAAAALMREVDEALSVVRPRCAFVIEARFVWHETERGAAESAGVSKRTAARLASMGFDDISAALKRCS